MSASSQPQIVHESEAQRQHVRLPVPATVSLDGKEFVVRDLSSAGIGLSDITGTYTVGALHPLTLRLPFGTFSMDINLRGEVQHANAAEKIMGLTFVDLSADQISLLNHVLKAFLAGDIIASGDLLNVAARENFVKSRGGASAKPVEAPSLGKQLPGFIMIALLGLAAVYVIMTNIYSSSFKINSADAYVSAPVVEARAASEGVYKNLLDVSVTQVGVGQVIGEISGGAPGSPVTQVVSPCDCLIGRVFVQDGQYTASGAPVVSLVPAQAKPMVLASIDPLNVNRIKPGSKVKITIAGNRREFSGRVNDMTSGMAGGQQAAALGLAVLPSTVTVTPDQVLPAELVNRPARVTFTAR